MFGSSLSVRPYFPLKRIQLYMLNRRHYLYPGISIQFYTCCRQGRGVLANQNRGHLQMSLEGKITETDYFIIYYKEGKKRLAM